MLTADLHEVSWSATLTVFDAQAIVAFLLDEPAAADVERELRDPTRPARISALPCQTWMTSSPGTLA